MKKPYVIAEVGVNHNGSVQIAHSLIDIAVEAGADCVKFQAFSVEDMIIKDAPKADYQKNNKNENQYEMLSKYELTVDDFKNIKSYCKNKNINFLATPFSERWVNILFNLGVDSFKISSASINTKSILSSVGKTKLPVILSTGMSTIEEIRKSINILQNHGCENLSLLHCVTLYPVNIEFVNLFSIQVLKEEFNLNVGFSDHTKEIDIGGLAVAAGATIIEKHFTLDKSFEGPDHAMSLSPYQLKEYIKYIRKVSTVCGKKEKKPLAEELSIKEVVQTSLVLKKKVKKGEIITKDMLVEKRPALGISVDSINDIIGKSVNKDIKKDSYLTFNDIEC